MVVGKQRIRNLGRLRLDINPKSYRRTPGHHPSDEPGYEVLVSTFHANVGNGARLFGDTTTYERTLAVA